MSDQGTPDRIPSRPPVSTYRLQLTGDFGFKAAAGLAGYLARLGVSHVYLSPILQAAPGSGHGYDVVDHSRVSADLGGEDDFRSMVARFREHGLGVVVDVVPNHMALSPRENRQLWSVLAGGPESEFAHWFDVDWAVLGGRLLLPILAGPVEDCLADLHVEGSPGVLRYFDNVLPLRPGTEALPIRDLLAAQHYELAHWRDVAARLNYRRFFDITSLIAIRQEAPDVFAATHEVLLRLMAEGLIDGLRIDHPDGLTDPRGYLQRLADATGGAWVVAEKILENGEELPPDWQCAGTTGYDALALVDGLFLDPAFPSPGTTFAAVAEVAKREIASRAFTPELARLARLLPGLGAADVHEVLVEMLAAFPVYRAYVHPGETPSTAAIGVIDAATTAAKRRLPDRLHAVADKVSAAVLGEGGGEDGGESEGLAEFVVRFQQATGPVLAKGVEDTACYRWMRLVSLNEVGSDPDRFGVGPAEFHVAAERLATRWPATLTTLSTHDTKRQEDVRARLATLSEQPDRWARAVASWHETTGDAIDPDTQSLIWQTLVGAWPIGTDQTGTDRTGTDRLTEYLIKAVREAKTHTSWSDPDERYESAVCDFAARAPHDSIAAFVAALAPDARVNSLGAKLVQLTMPGVPDVYQGCELPGYALVDPDNRRPVDFDRRRDMLATLDAAPPADLEHEKLLVTTSALRLRRDRPEWFAGAYRPLIAHGPAADHVIAFVRGGHAVTVATRLPAGLRRIGGWASTVLPLTLPDGHDRWRDVLTGAEHTGERVAIADLTRDLPVALLVPVRAGI